MSGDYFSNVPHYPACLELDLKTIIIAKKSLIFKSWQLPRASFLMYIIDFNSFPKLSIKNN